MRAALAIVGVALAAAPAAARERLTRVVDAAQGLPTAYVASLAQDADGFLWLGTAGGLVRWDGVRARTWGDRRALVERLATTPHAVWTVEPGGALHRIDADDPDAPARAVMGPDGAPLTDVLDLRVDAAGALWVADGGGLVHRDARGAWTRDGPIDGARVLHLAALRDGALLAATARAVYRRGARGWTPWLELADVVGVGQGARGEVWIATDGAALYEAADAGAPRPILRGRWAARTWDLAVRGDEAWMIMGGATVVATPGGAPEVIGDADRVPPADRALVDREGSVWLATQRGAVQLVEPATALWTIRDGIQFAAVRFVARTGEGVWAASWGAGWTRIDATTTEGGARAEVVRTGDDALLRNRLCVDGGGDLWTGSQGRLWRRRGGTWQAFPLDDGDDGVSCLALGDGRVLLSGARSLHVAAPGDAAPSAVPAPPFTAHPSQVGELLVDRGGRLWAASHEEICSASLADVTAGAPRWTCEPVPGADDIYQLAETPSGRLWMATEARGLLTRDGAGAWRDVAFAAALPSRVVHVAKRARDGATMWIAGPGFLRRVREDGAIVEELGDAAGVREAGGGDVIEDDDGTLWVATDVGLLEVPPRARRRPPAIVNLVLVGAELDGRPAPRGPRWSLAPGHNDLALEFSALSFRSPRTIRFRTRVDGAAWSEPRAGGSLRLVDLPAGTHQVDVEAAVDGERWSGLAAPIEVDVPGPWWRRPWLLALAVTFLIVAVAAIQRARYRVRLRLVQQRVGIAMDLHDEIGSGLGSIQMMAGMAGRVPAERRDELAGRVAHTAERLGRSLTDIVSALRPGGDRLDALIDHLVERGNALMPGDEPRFEVRPPAAWPDEVMSIAVRRTVQLIAVEALHNAARHAGAVRVELGAAVGRRTWRVWIDDDGVGLDGGAAPRPGGGHGLRAMRRRADAIGAVLELGPGASGRGTRVEIAFDPRARGRRA